MSKVGWRILYVWKQTSERRQNTWSPPFWQGQAIYAGPAAPEMTGWDWEQEDVGNRVRKATEGHLRREVSERPGKEQKDGKGHYGGREIKAGKGGLVKCWDKSGKLLFWMEQRRKLNAGKASRRVCIHWGQLLCTTQAATGSWASAASPSANTT